MQLPLTKKIVNKVIDANFTKASAVLVGGASEIEKAAQTAARNAIATALHKYYTDVNAKVGLETEKFKNQYGSCWRCRKNIGRLVV